MKPLTVGELIEALSALDPALPVASVYDGGQLVGALDVSVKTRSFGDEDFREVPVEFAVIGEIAGYELRQWATSTTPAA